MNSLETTLFQCRAKDHDNAHLYNFDHPDALDFDLAFEKINELVKGHDC
jgi:uridine kinase